MSNPQSQLQAGIVSTLKEYVPLALLIDDRVYDYVPRNTTTGQVTAEFPYVSIGPVDGVPDNADCIDADEITLQLDVWSRTVGQSEAKEIAWQVRQALRDFAPDLGLNALATFEFASERVFRDSDGLTIHGVITFTAVVEAN